ncbi:HNH endonuclease [Microbacteriaceae bacterium VKM Ac-2854]|nr:HNH endonuclease [Microbacteriaceae bacterium VKM Ac-2854]
MARDGGCAFPQCDLPATWADAHHVIHWADGGPTTLENTVLLCRQHHTLVHHSAWKIVMRDGIPYFVPPWQIDPHQTPRRNHRHRRPRAEQRFRPRKPAPPPNTDTGNRRT